jgi:hypothetical protein
MSRTRQLKSAKRFRFAYDQICLGFKDGGHGLRPWAQHGDAAFVGQWALSLSDNATEPEADLRPVGNQHGRASRLYGRLDRKGVVGPGISTGACGRHAGGSEASDHDPRDAGIGGGCCYG